MRNVGITFFQYVRELDADIMEAETFGTLIKSQPSLILFVHANAKGKNRKLLQTVGDRCLCFISELLPNLRRLFFHSWEDLAISFLVIFTDPLGMMSHFEDKYIFM